MTIRFQIPMEQQNMTIKKYIYINFIKKIMSVY